MTEIEISNGQNIIDIFFDDFASCLVVKKALAVNWPDCRGSVGEYYSISNYSIEERNFYTKTINSALSEGSDLEQIEAIKDFLNLFANGKYSINKFIAKNDEIAFLQSNQVTYAQHVPENKKFSGWFFPSFRSNYELIVYSITNDKIDSSRVEYYCELIEKGIRPTILTFDASDNLSSNCCRSYVLDGHHKIEAYSRLKIDIPVISIIKNEECKNRTSELLLHVKPILKDFEYQHLFENNDDNLLNIDFINEKELSDDLDSILKNSDRIHVSIINLLRKYANSKNQFEIEWLEFRLNSLKENRHINLIGFWKGLQLWEKKKDRKEWFPKTINSTSELPDWINSTINKSV